jgi:ComF family protein
MARFSGGIRTGGRCGVVYSAFVYEGAAAAAVKKLKFSGRRDAAYPFGLIMAEAVPAETARKTDAVSFVPLHAERERGRGYNQARLLAEALAENIGKPVIRTLSRPRGTAASYKLNPEERKENIAGAFAAEKGFSAHNKTVLLVDDVLTTGATLNECARVIIEAGAGSVIGATACASAYWKNGGGA